MALPEAASGTGRGGLSKDPLRSRPRGLGRPLGRAIASPTPDPLAAAPCSGADRVRSIADELGPSMAQLAVAWVLQENVAAAIIGASRPEQVQDNVKAADVRLSAEVMARVDEALGDVVERDTAKTSRG